MAKKPVTKKAKAIVKKYSKTVSKLMKPVKKRAKRVKTTYLNAVKKQCELLGCNRNH